MAIYDVKFDPNAKNHCWNEAMKLIDKKSFILDVGCSKGSFGEGLIKHKDCIVEGVEPDTEDATVAANKLHAVYPGYVEDALKKIANKKKYDHIAFIDVIEHLYEPTETLKMIKPYLKKNGSIIFSIPNMAHMSTRLMLLKGDFEYAKTGLLDKTHLRFYTQDEINKTFNEAGFTVTEWRYTEAKYPEELIIKELEKIGLKPTKKALSLFNEASAQIFQYIGKATLEKKPTTVKRLDYSPDPQGQITSLYESKLKKLEQYTQSLESQKSHLESEVKELKNEIKKIHSDDYMVSKLSLKTHIRIYITKKLKKILNIIK